MTVYHVYIPPEVINPDFISKGDAARVKFLPDNKMIWALIFPPIWLIWHRLWLPLMIYALAVSIIVVIAFRTSEQLGTLLSILPGLYLLLEGSELIRMKHERDGWQFVGIIEAPDLSTAELRYFSGQNPASAKSHDAGETRPSAAKRAPVLGRPASASAGLFPE